MSESGLVIDDLSVDYDSTRAVSGLSLHVPDGQTLAIVGPSGCGKSTVLRTIAGLTRPAEGRVVVGGRDLTHVPASARDVGLVPQNYALFPHLSVRGNIEYGLKARGVDKVARREAVDRLLAFTELTPLAQRRPSQLSGGQRQRVALARAMAIEPSVLLLDEPLAALDPQLRGAMRRQLLDLLGATTSINVIVTHDRHEALSMADVVAVMRDGRLVQAGSPRELWQAPADAFVADFLCGATYVDVVLDQDAVHAFDGRWAIPYAAVDAARPATGRARGRLLLRPDSLVLSEHRGTGTVPALVRHAEFVGESTLVTLEVAGTAVSVRTDQPVTTGTTVHAGLAGRPVAHPHPEEIAA
ncbi:ABC transporter ATP-binding protein [Xylanimonas oleitrophica]|uniref:ABC transporter ATP-binding protein n=1 Tax=Xylanimonas oleitrophica TaxID=2607479 RepID=UPI0015CFDE0C|nr:ABC transporter ATP-binding protein [Xylanimonas oleitrophica]